PYHSRGVRPGAAAITIAWIRSPIARSEAGISASFSRTAASPSCSPFSSLTRSCIAARSSAVKPLRVRFFVSAMSLTLARPPPAPTAGAPRGGRAPRFGGAGGGARLGGGAAGPRREGRPGEHGGGVGRGRPRLDRLGVRVDRGLRGLLDPQAVELAGGEQA